MSETADDLLATLEHGGRRSLAANGRSPGFTASLERREDGSCIIVLSNLYSTVSQSPIARDLASMLDGDVPTERAPLPERRDATYLTPYIGSYRAGQNFFNPGALFTVEALDGSLVLRMGEGLTLPLLPVGPHQFIDRMFWGRAVFSDFAAGSSQTVTWIYDGEAYRATREVAVTQQ